MSVQEKSLPTKGQAEIILSQRRILKLLQFKMDLIAMSKGLANDIPNLNSAYVELSECIDRIVTLEVNRKP